MAVWSNRVASCAFPVIDPSRLQTRVRVLSGRLRPSILATSPRPYTGSTNQLIRPLESRISMEARPLISALLIDLSGTLHIGSTPTPGAVHALQRLRDAKFPFRFCSNTSKESRARLRSRLEGMGFQIRAEDQEKELWTSLGAVKSVLQAKGLKKPFFLLTDSAREDCSPFSAEPDSTPSQAQTPYDSVVIGHAPSAFVYDNLNTAFRVLMGEDGHRQPSSTGNIPLIATHRAKYIASSTSELTLGPGPFVAALENATGVTAEVVGKPTRNFFETVIQSFDDERAKHGRIAVIGDDIEADLGGGAVELGLWRVLVKTGKYRSGDEQRAGVRSPDEVCDSFAIFVEDILHARP